MTTVKAKTTEERSPLDTAKLALAALLLAGGLVAFYMLPDLSQIYRVLGLLVVVAIAVGLFATTRVGRGLLGFIRDARTELRRVVWPTRQETLQTTLVVLVMVLIAAIFLWLLDMFLLWAVNGITGLGG